MKKIIKLMFLMSFFLATQAMEEEINFTFKDGGFCLKVPNNWFKEFNEYDRLSLGYESIQVTDLREKIKIYVAEKLDDVKSDIPRGAGTYDDISWRVYPLLLFKETDQAFKWAKVEEIPSWKMVVIDMKTKSHGSYFQAKLLLRERNPTLLKLSMVHCVEKEKEHWKNNIIFSYSKIKKIGTEERRAKKPQRC